MKTYRYTICGGKPVSGVVDISGAKNSVVAILPATVLVRGVCTLDNVPDISDVNAMLDILRFLGAKIISYENHRLVIDTSEVGPRPIGRELTGTCRASYYLLGVLLGMFGTADVALPGGCKFGDRPMDLHIKGFRTLGADVDIVPGKDGDDYDSGSIKASGKILTGAGISFDKESVGATINVMLAAVLAEGKTTIQNAAREPHIVDLASFLNQLGCRIMGAGTERITINGVPAERLKHEGVSHSIIADQIEAGTFMTLAAATDSELTVRNVIPRHLEPITAVLRATGVKVTEDEENDLVKVHSGGSRFGTKVTARPYPAFPTDMQPQMTTYLCLCTGESKVTEEVWATRFGYVDELVKFGANIYMPDNKNAEIRGIRHFVGTDVTALDLRAGAAMLIAGAAAIGVTHIYNTEYIERGYENIVNKLRGIGVDIKKEEAP